MRHGLPYDVNASILFTELPLLERPAAVKACGFDAVEFWWPFSGAVPGDGEVDAFVAAVRDAGVRLVGLNFFAGDMPAGDRGVLSSPGRSGEFLDSVDVAVGIGEALGCTAFNALYGNRMEGVPPEEQDDLALQNLAAAAGAAQDVGGVVLVEAVSGAPRYPILRAADAFEVMERVERHAQATNVRFLCDLYHLAVNGDDVAAVVERHAPGIGHVQVADAPGRGAPGSGELDLGRWLSLLEDGGYAGWVGLEYTAATTTGPDAFGWLPCERRGAGELRT